MKHLHSGRLWPPLPKNSATGAPQLPTAFPLFVLVLLAAALTSTGCSGAHAIARSESVRVAGLIWFAPALPSDKMDLASWAAAVGPPVVQTRTASVSPIDTLTVVSWNTALGTGNVARLLRDQRAADPAQPFVLLLQEVYRSGPEVPRAVLAGSRFAGKLGGAAVGRREIEAIAEAEGLNLYYVPSMRNGSPAASDEDRGNAILSTLPLSDLSNQSNQLMCAAPCAHAR